ncbi:unnamed protein product [Rotaria sp. Silwood2]|nr:unnamed protein product [Rotaria sp. Silwood2]CAF2624959.1 unnamed protein product [Rotaria sp. Silwood2]CAF2844752.1 unnamed protein product [Rotaria sp. Silwood2]CAF3049280.1 unnamed protein product [Rotaria sp. Silwood2]CAF4190606.1 unnamed protein product [Rotaria sp. Silwood2]
MNTSQLILFGICFIIFLNQQEIHAVQELYGQSSGRIRSPSIDINPSKIRNDFSKENTKKLDRTSYSRGISPTFIQSRHFHFDQLSRDNHDLGRPSTYQSQNLPSSYYTYGGRGKYLTEMNQEGCRLKNNYCSHDYQCCSGKCRCVRWSIMGKMSCWKKCF